MKYQKQESTEGGWIKASELTTGTQVTLASEVKKIASNFEEGKMQDVGKLKVKGFPEVKNVRLNKTTVNALVEAFGDESTDWVGKVLTAHTEKAVVAGKRVTILYLLPEGFEVGENADGYVEITKKKSGAGKEEEIKSEDLPF